MHPLTSERRQGRAVSEELANLRSFPTQEWPFLRAATFVCTPDISEWACISSLVEKPKITFCASGDIIGVERILKVRLSCTT